MGAEPPLTHLALGVRFARSAVSIQDHLVELDVMPPYSNRKRAASSFRSRSARKRRRVARRPKRRTKLRGRVSNKENAFVKRKRKVRRKRTKLSDYQRMKNDIETIKKHVAVDKLSSVYSWANSGTIGGLGDGTIHWIEPHLVGHSVTDFWQQHYLRTTEFVTSIRPTSMLYRLKFMRVNPFSDVTSGNQWPFDIKFKLIVCYWSNTEAFGKSGSIVHTTPTDLQDVTPLPYLHEFYDSHSVTNLYNNQNTNLDGAKRLSKAQFQAINPLGTGRLDPKPFLMEYDFELKHGQIQRAPDSTSGLFLDAVDMHIAPMSPLDDGTVQVDLKFDPKLFKCNEIHQSAGQAARMVGIPRIAIGVITSFPPQITTAWYNTTYLSGLPYAAHIEYEYYARMRADYSVQED